MKRILLGVGFAVCSFLFVGYLSFYFLAPESKTDTPAYSVTETPPAGKSNAVDSPIRQAGNVSSPGEKSSVVSRGHSGPRVAIVIDDLGWEMETASVYDRIDASLTMALLPGRPNSRRLYNRWKNKFEFIIHMPMEPEGYPADDPGDHALMTSMAPEQIRRQLNSMFERYPRAVGLNNHMGSAFTRQPDLMGAVMQALSRRNKYYFDSGTTPGSAALSQAEKWNVKATKNQVFLDNERDGESIEDQLDRLVEIAREHGQSIGIGHIQSPETARVLNRRIPELKRKGINFVSLSEIMGIPGLHARR